MTTVEKDDEVSVQEFQVVVDDLKVQYAIEADFVRTDSEKIAVAETFAAEIKQLFPVIGGKFSNGEIGGALQKLGLNNTHSEIGVYRVIKYSTEKVQYAEDGIFSSFLRKQDVKKYSLPAEDSFLSLMTLDHPKPKLFILESYPYKRNLHRPLIKDAIGNYKKQYSIETSDKFKLAFFSDIPVLLEAFNIWIENQA